MTLDSTLLFISDLHLGPSFHEETDTLPLDWPMWSRLYRRRLDEFFADRCVAHNKVIVRALPRYVRRLIVALQRRGVYHRDTVDQCVALGDLVTWPNPDAFEFFRQYMTRDRWIDAQSSQRLPGMDIQPDGLTAIPGNHDKLLRQNLDWYNAYVSVPLGIEAVSPQGAQIIRRTVGSKQFAFLAIDASIYTTDPELRVTRAARYHLAGGSVSQALLTQVTVLARQMLTEEAIRVLLIHYPADFPIASGLNGFAHNVVLKHDVDGIGKLLSAIPQGAIHFAVHGHLHNPGLYSVGGFPVLSLGTTFQLGASVNDFYLVTVSDSGQIRAEHHVWSKDKTGFCPDPSLSGRLN